MKIDPKNFISNIWWLWEISKVPDNSLTSSKDTVIFKRIARVLWLCDFILENLLHRCNEGSAWEEIQSHCHGAINKRVLGSKPQQGSNFDADSEG